MTTGAGDDDDERIRELLRTNAALDEQVKQLVRAEQKVYLSQRDLARQIARLDALNRFALDVAGLASRSEILGRAADVLFDLFPLDQYAGFLAGEGGFVPAAVRAQSGREARAGEVLAELRATALRLELGPAPIVDRADAIHAARGDAAVLLAFFERIFSDAAGGSHDVDADAWVLLVPIVRRGAAPDGVMVFRRLDAALSFHEELPTARDVAFLGVFAQQVAAALTNAQLVGDLRASYARLADVQRELVARERLAALGELAAVVAHEVRNPLGAIFNSISMLGRMVPARGDAARLVDIVREESERLNQIVSDLIDFARPHSASPREESIVGIASGAIDSVRDRFPHSAIAIRVEGPLPPPVWVDARMVRQALLNLLVNAVQASREGAEVVVRISPEPSGRVRVAVVDQGVGVPEAVAARVFEPFFTTKPTGTGLGLSVVKRVADAHGAPVELTSCAGQGSTFALLLPAVRLEGSP